MKTTFFLLCFLAVAVPSMAATTFSADSRYTTSSEPLTYGSAFDDYASLLRVDKYKSSAVMTIVLNDFYHDLSPEVSSFTLENFAILSRNDAKEMTGGKLAVYSGDTLLGLSTALEYPFSTSNSSRLPLNFSFADSLVTLDKTTTYTFKVVTATSTMENITVESNFGFSVADISTATGDPSISKITADVKWQPLVSMDLSDRGASIPEPSTATLGLLGLAGLLMRRRRLAVK